MMQVTRAAFQAVASLNLQATVRTVFARFSSIPRLADSDGRNKNLSPFGINNIAAFSSEHTLLRHYFHPLLKVKAVYDRRHPAREGLRANGLRNAFPPFGL
jgi:hypothetical protein